MAHSITHDAAHAAPVHHTPWYRVLYIQVLIAIALGIMLGWYSPEWGKSLNGWATASSL